ncbi:acetyltransferase GCN5 [Jannaschia pagri]|uniref:Acetyltransferase GCN5 n=1 Tax=Jannaschia pagri TaxID=2829797 RepID=A0ABQ4NI26_9RHOB|nr:MULTISPECIES: GNAT family N-acetyltransferase [unclassified Jannaschia]GIT89821.1 acetyltransferase GCN5 [Jannaschia sp. AI_61]GIT94072.1 acetyltransferase GCN5 [Jannaschia sp. AI_62]
MKVGPADPTSPGCAALLAQSHAMMNALFAPGECHYLDLDALTAPHIRFIAATEGDRTLGTGALALRDGYAEVKSMFTDPEARGRGVADAILTRLITLAATEGRPIVRLETGVGLDAAHRLYRRHGFVECGPFGGYKDIPASLFFERIPKTP